MSAPLLKDVFDIPETTGTEDYVLRLKDATSGAGAAEALATYVVTEQIAGAFDSALALVDDALATGKNRGAFLTGSFGAGKSHFMAVLHAVLRHEPAARSITGLQNVIARHDPTLGGKRILPLSFHFLTGETIEQVLFDGYVEQVRALHPDAPLPAVYVTDEIIRSAEKLRGSLGDEKFLAGLGTGSDPDDEWGGFAGGWDLASYEAARDAARTSKEHRSLITDLSSSYFTAYARTGTHVGLDEGLPALSQHAKDLGYDAVVLFLDELILWLAFQVRDDRFSTEVQKLSKLVEGDYARGGAPLVSVIARQIDLRTWFADSGTSGNEQVALEQALDYQEGRFARIELGDDNLAHVAAARLLRPKNDEARAAIDAAFSRLDDDPELWNVLLDGVNTDDQHPAADRAQFRLTYPFSPVLVSTLRSLANVMQRERTALKVMQEMLRDRRDTMTIDELIPVGDAYPYISDGGAVLDSKAKALFDTAHALNSDKLLPAIRASLSLTDTPDEQLTADEQRSLTNDERLAHTLLLSAIAPGFPALKNLTPTRLAHLNHGSIRTFLPRGEADVVAAKVRDWSGQVPEIAVTGPDDNPVYALTLSNVDIESVVQAAREEHNAGRERELLRSLFLEDAELTDDASSMMGGARPITITWRSTPRTVELLFANVRDTADLPDSRFHNTPGTWQLIVDLPIDVEGHPASEDVARLAAYQDRADHDQALVWLPRHLSVERRRDLHRLVILEHLRSDAQWEKYSRHLAVQDRTTARLHLDSNREQLRSKLITALRQAYGATSPIQGNLAPGQDHRVVTSLHQAVTVPTPEGPSLSHAFRQITQSAWDQTYPEHPHFPEHAHPEDDLRALTGAGFKALTAHVQRIGESGENRVALEGTASVLDEMRRLTSGLHVGNASSTHYVLDAEHLDPWSTDINRNLAQAGAFGPGDTITLGALHDAIRATPAGAGLTAELVDTVAFAWVSLEQRAWYRNGAPTNERVPGTREQLDRSIELRPQPLPTEEDWATAGRRAGSLFGIEAKRHVTARTVKTLAEQVRAKAQELSGPAQDLVDALQEALLKRGVRTDTPRTLTARSAARLVSELRGLSGTELVNALAHAELSGTEAEVARSLMTLAGNVRALKSVQWDRYAQLDSARGEDLAADAVVQDLANALRAQEFATPLASALQETGNRLFDWLSSRAAATPAPTPTPTSSAPGAAGAPATGAPGTASPVAPAPPGTAPTSGALGAGAPGRERTLTVPVPRTPDGTPDVRALSERLSQELATAVGTDATTVTITWTVA